MIDCTRWVIAEAWLANGLRVKWALERFGDDPGGWIQDEGYRHTHYRYAGFGEWEVARRHNYIQRPFGEDAAPELSTATMIHELAHWLVASPEERHEPNFGLGNGDLPSPPGADEGEAKAVAAEAVIKSITNACARIASMALQNDRGQ